MRRYLDKEDREVFDILCKFAFWHCEQFEIWKKLSAVNPELMGIAICEFEASDTPILMAFMEDGTKLERGMWEVSDQTYIDASYVLQDLIYLSSVKPESATKG